MYRGRILAITDAPFAETGYGNQSDKILTELVKRGWEVYHICGNYFPSGKETLDDEGFMNHKGIKCILYPKIWDGPDHLYPSKEFVKEWYDKLRPDAVWTLNDFYRVAAYLELGEEFVKKWVHWLPVDNDIPDKHWAEFENKMHFFVFLTKFGEEHESPFLPNIEYKTMIYHGINPDEFKPLPKDEIKNAHGMKNVFTITTVARHQPRKMVYHTAKAVCTFLQKHKDAVWICKANPNDSAMEGEPEMERDLIKLVASYGVSNQVMFVPNNLPTDQLNDLFNTGDIFITLPGGEGFNIPVAESMMAGVPCIVTNSTSGPELLKDGELGVLARVETKKYVQKFGILYDVANIDDAVNGLEMAYSDWKNGGKVLKSAGMECREYAIEKFSVGRVTDQWEDVFWRIMRYNNPILWYSHFGRGIGFSAISEAIVPELDKLGYDTYIFDLSHGAHIKDNKFFSDKYIKYLNSTDKIDFRKKIQVICHLMDTFGYIEGDTKLGWSLAESTKIIEHYVAECEKADYIITSSQFNKDVQKNSGISKPIVIVPPCLKPGDYPYMERPEIGSRPFTFLHVGVIQERKNVKQLIQGYLTAFPDGSKTKLIVKSGDFGVVDELKERLKERPDIEFVYTTSESPLSREEMLKLYASADCYVNLSHGEGIGMPDMEALSTGLPVIGSNWDTRALFLDDEVGWMVKVSGMDKAYKMTFPDDDCGEWAMFDDEDYCRILKYVAEHPEEAREKGRKGSERIKNFTPEKSAKAMDEVFMDIYKSKNKKRRLEPEIIYHDSDIPLPNYSRVKNDEVSLVVPEDRLLVAIPTKDRVESLRRTFYSLMHQSMKNFDIFIVDDSCEDIQSFKSKFTNEIELFKKMNVNIEFVRGDGTNQADAHNKALRYASENKYKVVFRCDDDVTLEPDALEKMFLEFVKDKKGEYAAVGMIILNPYFPKNQQRVPNNWKTDIRFAGKIDPCLLYAQVMLYPDVMDYRDDVEHLYSSYMYRPELLNLVGGFPSNLSKVGYREETYGLYELYLMGYKLRIVTKALGYHWGESSGGCRCVQGEEAMRMYEHDEKIFQGRIRELEEKYKAGKR